MKLSRSPRIINGNTYDMLTVDGMDRCQINNHLHYLNVEMDKLKAQQAKLVQMRDMMDYELEREELGDLYDQMFGG
jgi:hypothetical protein